jgi:hypothetical protein
MKILCTITWSDRDVAEAFREKHGREPTEQELGECLERLDDGMLEEVCIERGWSVVQDAV